MQFPLGFSEISLWLAIMAILVLTTAELISLYHGQTNILVDKGRLRKAAFALGTLFILTILIMMFQMAAQQ